MMGFSFLRQRPIASYIADFFCKELKLIIETDGISHSWEGAAEKDQQRTEKLATLGYTVLRFDDKDVMRNIDYVRETIERWIVDHPPPPFKGGHSNG